MADDRRHPPPVPALAALLQGISATSSEVLRTSIVRALGVLEDYLRHLRDGFSGAPAPHAETHIRTGSDPLQAPSTPTTVDAGSATSAGDGPAYAYDDHEHGVTTGTPVALGESLAEGSGAALARASHVHALAVRVAKEGSTVGTRKRINFIEGAGASLTVTDDAGGDEVDVTFTVIGGSVEDAMLFALLVGS